MYHEIYVYVVFSTSDHSISACCQNSMRIVAMTTLETHILKVSLCRDVEKFVILPLIICLRYTLSELMLHDAFFGPNVNRVRQKSTVKHTTKFAGSIS